MNANLLRMARKDSKGIRTWSIPGYGNAAKLTPSAHTGRGWGPSFRWPDRDHHRGEHTKAVDLDRHRWLARAAAYDLIHLCVREAKEAGAN